MQMTSPLAIFLVLTVLTSTVSSVYYPPMMSCEQFCQMLTKDAVRQVWCLIGVCKNVRLRRKLVKYSKRSGGAAPMDEGEVPNSGYLGGFEWLRPRISSEHFDYYLAGLIDKRKRAYLTERAEDPSNDETLLKVTK